MSLRRRLAVIAFLAAVVLVAAIASITNIIETSDASREEVARSSALAAAEALARALRQRGAAASDGTLAAPTEELRRSLEALTMTTLLPLPRVEGGYCSREGALVAQAHGGTRPEARNKYVLGNPGRAGVERACEDAGGAGGASRVRLPHEVLLIATADAGPEGAAWALARMRPNEEWPSPWQIEVVVLALGTLLLVVITLDAMIALRRGVTDLGLGLSRLEGDLRAELPVPRAQELAHIAAGVQAMGLHLAEAHEREHGLARTLAHEQRLAALGRVVAGVAHEIRNPLAGMKLRLDLMARAGGLPPQTDEDIRACLDEVARLDRVVRSLLIVARRGPAERRPVPLGALVDERARLSSEGAGGEVRVRRSGDALVQSDPDALARVLDNLLRNAIEASPRGAEVAVELCESRGEVTVDVVDQGGGVPSDRELEMFEPFFTTKPEGTGLGLWMSRSLVEALGGKLDYARRAGQTRFRVLLPAPPPAREDP